MKLYLDTSIFGGYYDEEFAEETKKLFELIRSNNIVVFYSEIVVRELEKAPSHVRELLRGLKLTSELPLNSEALALADLYIQSGALTKKSFDDACHVAVATLGGAELVVSWNCKHLVQYSRIKGFNSINLRLGHRLIDIRTPPEINYDYENFNTEGA